MTLIERLQAACTNEDGTPLNGGVDTHASVATLRECISEIEKGRTGWPPGLLQDDCSGLSRWFASKPDARRRVREALSALEA